MKTFSQKNFIIMIFKNCRILTIFMKLNEKDRAVLNANEFHFPRFLDEERNVSPHVL